MTGRRVSVDSSIPKGLLAPLCAAVFLAAGGSNPYGLHSCPHHDGRAAPAPEHGTGSPPSFSEEVGQRVSHRQPGGHSSRGPCTCVGTCHASAQPPVPGADGAAVPRSDPIRGSSASVTALDHPEGPRHSLFELHLPNAPPLTA